VVAHSQRYVILTPAKRNHALAISSSVLTFDIVARIMKNALPGDAKIAKEAKECMQECVSEFISFITSEGMQFWIS